MLLAGLPHSLCIFSDERGEAPIALLAGEVVMLSNLHELDLHELVLSLAWQPVCCKSLFDAKIPTLSEVLASCLMCRVSILAVLVLPWTARPLAAALFSDILERRVCLFRLLG